MYPGKVPTTIKRSQKIYVFLVLKANHKKWISQKKHKTLDQETDYAAQCRVSRNTPVSQTQRW